MKESTKSKLKKVAFGVSIGFNALMLLLLGVGLSRCDTPKTPVEASPSVSTRAAGRFLERRNREALVSGPNLLEDASVKTDRLVTWVSSDWYRFDESPYWRVYYIRLEAGDYFYENTKEDGRSYCGNILGVSDSENADVLYALEHASGFSPADGVSFYNYTPSDTWHIITLESAGWCYFGVPNNNTPYLTLVDSLAVDPSAVINFPDNYNPMAMFAMPQVGVVFADYAPSQILQWVDFNVGVRIAGKFYSKISYQIARMDLYNYVDGNGDEHILGSGETWGAWGESHAFVFEIRAYATNGSYITLWQMNTYSKVVDVVGVKHTEFVVATNMAGSWATPEFRNWEIVAPLWSTPEYPSTRFPDFDAIELLSVRSSEVTGAVYVGGADVFSLLAGGFNAWTGIFSVQLLPSLTIGALLFVPLVVVIIWALVRLLAK